MTSNGAIICFQKYTIGCQTSQVPLAGAPLDTETADQYGPVCLGYFNRVDVKRIHQFRDYVKIASKHEAARACSRKQLLLRTRKGLHEQIDLRDSADTPPGELPFFSAVDEQKYAIGCCSVFSIRDGACKKASVHNHQCRTRRELAEFLYQKIDFQRNESNFKFAIMEILGTEDLCLLVLTNRYQCISDVISQIQLFSCNNVSQTQGQSPSCVIDNMHSILMVDRAHTQWIPQDGWDGIQAEIRFSLRSAAGLHYLRTVEKHLTGSGFLRTGESVHLAGCTGEYDAILHCPARLLADELFGKNGFFHPDNSEYRKSVYQSETFTSPLGISDYSGEPAQLPPDMDCASREELNQVVDSAIQALRRCFGFKETDIDFDYLELPIWRLLKDYWSFASFPSNNHLREDLKVQLIVSINAIVREAELCVKAGRVDRFLTEYDQIVDALGASMQAGSQQDRWNFGEQRSYIQNVDSYNKILRCYYGMIKDMLTLLYKIERDPAEEQPLLIPLLSFGVRPMIKSDRFHSYINGRDAELICIRLPYQALANPPKYLGVLAHEIFHYASPSQRTVRNQLMLKTLIRVALSEFISVLARTQEYTANEEYWKVFFQGDDSDRQFFSNLVEQTYRDLENTLQKHSGYCVSGLRLSEIGGVVLPEILYFSNNPSEVQNYSFYYDVWVNMRKIMQNEKTMLDPADLLEDSCQVWQRIFGLEKTESAQAVYLEIMNRVGIDYVKDMNNLLYSTFKAMEECPPDIFDLETVLVGQTDNKKIEQFLWQIHGTKREFMMKNRRKAPAQIAQEAGILKNEIRVSMLITSYLNLAPGESPVEKLMKVLEDWAPESGKYSDSLGRVRQEFISEFQYVNDRFEGILDENTQLCKRVVGQMRLLAADPDCRVIMERLSEMYKRYFQILTLRQRGDSATSEQTYQNDLFALCADLIDEYQSQAPFDIHSATSASPSTSPMAEAAGSPCAQDCLSRLACTSADLAYAVEIACQRMKVAGDIPTLWYRGQRQEDWLTLPNIMRLKQMNSEMPQPESFESLLKDEIRWAKAHILPQGMDFSDAEWLAYLQHYEFKTSVLDFSESLYPALYFAAEDWEDRDGFLPEKNAAILVFNPILFNLAMRFLEALEGGDAAQLNESIRQLVQYYREGTQFDQPPLFAGNSIAPEYRYLFDFANAAKGGYPRAVLVPRHCDRMDKQSGEFIYFGVGTPRRKKSVDGTVRYNYDWCSLESLHETFMQKFQECKAKFGEVDFVPFLFKIELNRHRYVGFKEHLRSVGLNKYSVYPEHDKLAFDLKKQLKME